MAQAIELKPICKYEYDKTTKDLFLVSPEGQGVYYKINDLKKIFPLDVKKYNAIVFPSYGDHGFIDFEGVDLSDFQISGKLCSINFINASFVGSTLMFLPGNDIANALFNKANFSGAKLYNVYVRPRKSGDQPRNPPIFNSANFTGAALANCGFLLVSTNFSAANFSNAKVMDSAFSGSDFSEAIFFAALVANCTIQSCDFSEADLTSAKFEHCTFVNCNFKGAKGINLLTFADCKIANPKRDLRGTVFESFTPEQFKEFQALFQNKGITVGQITNLLGIYASQKENSIVTIFFKLGTDYRRLVSEFLGRDEIFQVPKLEEILANLETFCLEKNVTYKTEPKLFALIEAIKNTPVAAAPVVDATSITPAPAQP